MQVGNEIESGGSSTAELAMCDLADIGQIFCMFIPSESCRKDSSAKL
jgi:hypothetical protein